jgi:hypothetical protein
MAFNGWMLPDSERARVLGLFPPRYPVVKASHITLSIDDKTIPADAEIVIVGHADDDNGMEALVCTVNGETRRPDGGLFHLTLSHQGHRAAKEANEVVAQGYARIPGLVPITTRAFLSNGTSYITTPLSGGKK